MHIAIDARELLGQPTGVGRYLAELLARWTRAPDAGLHELQLVAPEPLDRAAAWRGTGGAGTWDVVVPGGRGTRWEQTTLALALRRLRPDVLFAPAYTAPVVAPCPIVVTMHDVSFAAHPEWFPRIEGARRRVLSRLTAARARRILTVSAFSRDEIVRQLRVGAGKIRVIPQAADTHACFGRPAPDLDARREPLVLYVGSVLNRRRVPDLIAAFRRLGERRRDARLVLVGDNRTHPLENLRAMVAHIPSIEWREYVGEQELRGLYARARAFAFLSEYEGFGLTPLEAIRAGVPPVVLDTPVARDVLGTGALFVQRGDLDGLAAALEQVLDDTTVRAQVLEGGRLALGRYSWDRTASATLDALAEAATVP